MSMDSLLSGPERLLTSRRARAIYRWTATAWFMGMAAAVQAQGPGVHYLHHGAVPPGAIGGLRLQRGGPLPGYFQPVQINAPEGTTISMAVDGAFSAPSMAPVSVAMLIAPVYRIRISNIPFFEGQEVFPTIEVIDRLYSPPGEARRFPIPIDITQEDLELALEGKFVTRVVYLEDPSRALPVVEHPDRRNWFDAGPGVNPLEEADRWGRPVAILRMGARVPDDRDAPDEAFLYGCPPFTVFRPWIVEPAEAVPVDPDSPPSPPALEGFGRR